MNFKKSLIIGASVLTLAPVASATFVSSYAYADEIKQEQTSEAFAADKEVYEFTNSDFYEASKIAYNKGEITENEYSYIQSLFQMRIGAKGVNKFVEVGENRYELYLNSYVAGALVKLGAGAITLVLAQIPGVSSVLSTNGGILLGAAAGGIADNGLDTSNGIIINYTQIPATDQYGSPTFHYRFNSVRDQW